jgi:hypothetical protein
MQQGQYTAAAMYMYPYASMSELGLMDYYLGIMSGEIYDHGDDWGMAYEYYATPFRADMAGYNSASSLFKSIFNAAYREYYAATGDTGGNARNYLAGMRAQYTACVSRTPWTYPPPDIETT